jgi:hypothetical protein
MSAASAPQISSATFGPVWIMVGLALMMVVAFYPNAPVVTAIALIALGTTEVVVSRPSKWPWPLAIVLLHGTTYAMLYAIFIGARLYTPPNTRASSPTLLTMLDLAASTLPMAIAARRMLAYIRASVLPRP